MSHSRRTVLFGIGVALGGSSIHLMQSVATDVGRAHDGMIEFVTDDTANLAMRPGRDVDFIQYEESSDGEISVAIDLVNSGGRTTIADLIEFHNQGDNTITDIEVSGTMEGDVNLEVDSGIEDEISPGDSATGIRMTVDFRDIDEIGEFYGSFRIEVETDA